MILQEKRILCNVKEPDKNHLWLRPRLDRDGYDLLYWGAKGWTPLIDCLDCPFKKINSVSCEETFVEIPDISSKEDEEECVQEPPISENLSGSQDSLCGCLAITN